MFRETLLESSIARRKRNTWPMATAFAAEVIVAALLVALPLLSTGVISVSAHPPHVVPLGRPDLTETPRPPAGGKLNPPRSLIVNLPTTGTRFHQIAGPYSSHSDEAQTDLAEQIGVAGGMPNLPLGGQYKPPVLQRQEPAKPVLVSQLSEAQLLTRVEPIYPRIAIITGTQGEVRLHAIIARDGSIQSLSIMNGASPILANAAVNAVRQWRYKPYYLNGQPVEVETFITVNFKKTNE